MPLLKDLVTLGVGRRAALEVQLALQLLVAIEVLDGVRGADFHGDERLTVGRLAELAHPHPIGRARDERHVLDNLVPAHELVIGPDSVTGKLLRRRQVLDGAAAHRRHGHGQAEHEHGDEGRSERASNHSVLGIYGLVRRTKKPEGREPYHTLSSLDRPRSSLVEVVALTTHACSTDGTFRTAPTRCCTRCARYAAVCRGPETAVESPGV